MAGEKINVYLLRHGEAAGNVQGGYYGRTDCPLTPAGRLSSVSAGKKLQAHLQAEGEQKLLLISSPLQRARDTAAIVQQTAGLTCPIVIEPAWQEIDFGTWEGRRYEDLQREYPADCQRLCADWQNFCYPQGESFSQFCQRVIAAWQSWLAEARRQQAGLVVVSHGGVLKVIRLWTEGRPWYDFWRIQISLGELQHLLVKMTVINHFLKLPTCKIPMAP